MNKFPLELTGNQEIQINPKLSISVMPKEPKLAEAYVPYQVMYKIYEPMKALMKGTLFPELYRPYAKSKHDR
ncbi:MAG: hypothetical protein K0R84_1220 [Clostridia bacterium]|jgi:hypothetical protein|nr:hypothetical protein [Clostridia bacterium]